MNPWQNLLQTVASWRDQLEPEEPPTPPEPGESYLQTIERTLAATEPAVVAACTHLARHQTLPALTRAEQFHLWARLEYARELLLSLQSAPMPCAAPGPVLQWLLTDCWQRGRQRFLQRVRDVTLLESATPHRLN